MVQIDLTIKSNSIDKDLFNKIITAIVQIDVGKDEVVEVLCKPNAIKRI